MGILGAFVIAIIVAILFSPYKRKDSVMPMVILFLVLFAAGVAGQFWIVPFGPVIGGVAWLPTLFIILLFALLFSAPPPHSRTTNTTDAEPMVNIMSIFTWLILFILLVAILLGLYNSDALIAD